LFTITRIVAILSGNRAIGEVAYIADKTVFILRFYTFERRFIAFAYLTPSLISCKPILTIQITHNRWANGLTYTTTTETILIGSTVHKCTEVTLWTILIRVTFIGCRHALPITHIRTHHTLRWVTPGRRITDLTGIAHKALWTILIGITPHLALTLICNLDTRTLRFTIIPVSNTILTTHRAIVKRTGTSGQLATAIYTLPTIYPNRAVSICSALITLFTGICTFAARTIRIAGITIITLEINTTLPIALCITLTLTLTFALVRHHYTRTLCKALIPVSYSICTAYRCIVVRTYTTLIW